MLLISGRTATGKDELVNYLTHFGAKKVVSYATRPKRFEGEETHRFISPEEAAKITNRVAETKIGQYEYFVTADQVRHADVYIIDPIGVKCLSETMPNHDFNLVYLVSDREKAKEMALKRAADPKSEGEIFDRRAAAEDAEFSQFEQMLMQDNVSHWFLSGKSFGEYLECQHNIYPNVMLREIFRNTFDKEAMEREANYLFKEMIAK